MEAYEKAIKISQDNDIKIFQDNETTKAAARQEAKGRAIAHKQLSKEKKKKGK